MEIKFEDFCCMRIFNSSVIRGTEQQANYVSGTYRLNSQLCTDIRHKLQYLSIIKLKMAQMYLHEDCVHQNFYPYLPVKLFINNISLGGGGRG